MTDVLAFSKSVGNDLSTPMPQFGFRDEGWRPVVPVRRPLEQAREAGCAPKVRLLATNSVTLAVCRIEDLKTHAIDLQ